MNAIAEEKVNGHAAFLKFVSAQLLLPGSSVSSLIRRALPAGPGAPAGCYQPIAAGLMRIKRLFACREHHQTIAIKPLPSNH
ncbi:MAG: hypothetical protein Q8R06_02090 [Polaromonas sp.]|uniref:hypothetical protein n=1 Tax=Polaromonas sp. TaxID=1869339 RepID=UPI00273525B5|nr:hypothetical protein [Polaromonas sp.]MDP3795926.1 hypothetical protein [Polaromonas sp.]